LTVINKNITKNGMKINDNLQMFCLNLAFGLDSDD